MRYIPNTPKIVETMLEEIGSFSLDEMFSSIPEDIQLKRDLNIPLGMAEKDQLELFQKLAENNTGKQYSSFLGAGCYDHFIPLVIDTLISRPEFFTSYTPYQAEASQGTLQAIFEFQSFICELTGMEVSNASVYDGACALAEAILMSARIQKKRKKVLLPESLHPHYRSVVETYVNQLPILLETIPMNEQGEVDTVVLEQQLDAEVICVVLQQPNFYGVIENTNPIIDTIREAKALLVLVTSEAMSLVALETPRNLGADIVVGEAQSFGVPMSYGGPYVGFMACLDQYKRNLPGRIVGRTLDQEGKDGFVLTLTSREQHIRRGRATSNICTNQNLIMLMVTFYLTLMGKNGLQNVVYQNMAKAQYLATEIQKIDGYSLPYHSSFFNEFTIQTPKPAKDIVAVAKEKGIIPGLDLGRVNAKMEHCLLIAVTENVKREQMDQLLDFLKSVA